MKAHIVTLPGDGIGPEVVQQAVSVLEKIAGKFNHEFSFEEYLIGGCSIDKSMGHRFIGLHLVACKKADAVLLGAVGGPKWDDPAAKVRPEQGLLGLRKGLQVFANLRPVKMYPSLITHLRSKQNC